METDREHKPLVSVVIPVRNGAGTLRSCLDGIFRQTLRDRLEVIILDSGSTDGTLELLKEYPVAVHPVAPGEFNHGETRNAGVRLAKGEFVVLTVQDATPATDDWIERMLVHFSDPQVAGVCGQQIVPHDPEKNPLQWFIPAGEATPRKICFTDPQKFLSLPGREQHAYCNWDDVNAVYRRSDKEQLPFRKLMFAEDTLWAKDALEAGKSIVYDYRARVYHYHHQDFSFYFKRTYIILYQNFKFYGYIRFPENPFSSVPKIIVRMVRKRLGFTATFWWILYNLKLVAAAWSASLIFSLAAGIGGMRGIESSQKFFVGYPPQGVQSGTKKTAP
jgi:rhamnosyltransferase